MGKTSLIRTNPLTKPLAALAEAKQRQAGKYVTKTIGWRPDDQAKLDELRGVIAGAGGGIWTETDTLRAAVRHALKNPAALRR